MRRDKAGPIASSGSCPVCGKQRFLSRAEAKRAARMCERTVFLDLGDELLLVGCIYPETPIGGWGYLWPREQVIAALNEPAPSTHTQPVPSGALHEPEDT